MVRQIQVTVVQEKSVLSCAGRGLALSKERVSLDRELRIVGDPEVMPPIPVPESTSGLALDSPAVRISPGTE